MEGRPRLSTPLTTAEVVAEELHNGEVGLRPRCAETIAPEG